MENELFWNTVEFNDEPLGVPPHESIASQTGNTYIAFFLEPGYTKSRNAHIENTITT